MTKVWTKQEQEEELAKFKEQAEWFVNLSYENLERENAKHDFLPFARTRFSVTKGYPEGMVLAIKRAIKQHDKIELYLFSISEGYYDFTVQNAMTEEQIRIAIEAECSSPL